jgi:hypothetical protein
MNFAKGKIKLSTFQRSTKMSMRSTPEMHARKGVGQMLQRRSMSWHPWIILPERACAGWTKKIAQTTHQTNAPTFLYRNNNDRLSRNYVLLETATRK